MHDLGLELIRRAKDNHLSLGWGCYLHDWNYKARARISREEAMRLLNEHFVREQTEWLEQNHLFCKDWNGEPGLMNKLFIMYEICGTEVHAVYVHDENYYLVIA